MNRIRREVKIPEACISDVYAAPTVQQLAARLAEYDTDAKDAEDLKDEVVEVVEETDGKLASEECHSCHWKGWLHSVPKHLPL